MEMFQPLLTPNDFERCERHNYTMVGGTPCFYCASEKADSVTFAPLEADPHGKDPHAPGAKLDAGKIKAGVLVDFALALTEVAKVGTFGADKYTRGGWQEVPDGVVRYGDAMWRHLLKARHEDNDPDSGLTHLAHAAWNALAVLELIQRGEPR